MGRSFALLFALFVASCAGAHPSDTPATPIASSAPPPSASPSQSPSPSSVTDASTEANADASASLAIDAGTTEEAAKPAPVERTGKTWPFHAWDRAEAFTFNRFPMRSGAPFRVYDDNGFSKHIADRKPLDAARAKQALDLVLAGKSELEMTKCPFPRHAVVFYEKDIPVASVNVCFECGDILLWPRWGHIDWGKLTDAQKDKALAESEAESAKKEKAFAQVFPKWKTFFRDSVGFPIDEQWH